MADTAKNVENVQAAVNEEGNNVESSEPDPIVLKSLKIKYGVVKRLTKDKLSYEKEARQQSEKLEQYKTEGKDEAILKNARNCLKETEMMVPDVCRRLVVAFGELKEIVDANREMPAGKTPEFADALRVMEEASTHLCKSQ